MALNQIPSINPESLKEEMSSDLPNLTPLQESQREEYLDLKRLTSEVK